MRGLFYERFQVIVHKIVMVTLTNALRSVCIKGNLQILMSKEIIKMNILVLKELLVQLFNNSHLVEVSAVTATISVILQNNPIFYCMYHMNIMVISHFRVQLMNGVVKKMIFAII